MEKKTLSLLVSMETIKSKFCSLHNWEKTMLSQVTKTSTIPQNPAFIRLYLETFKSIVSYRRYIINFLHICFLLGLSGTTIQSIWLSKFPSSWESSSFARSSQKPCNEFVDKLLGSVSSIGVKGVFLCRMVLALSNS